MKKCDVFVHLAAYSANVPYESLVDCFYWNVQKSLELIEQAVRSGVRKFLIAGSCFEYGRSADKYDFIPVNEPLEPILSYPTSKAAASIAFTTLAAEHNVKMKICRLFQVYGEGEYEGRFCPSLK